jgi:hypothetical protein
VVTRTPIKNPFFNEVNRKVTLGLLGLFGRDLDEDLLGGVGEKEGNSDRDVMEFFDEDWDGL